jgi:hypothetical protein
MDNRELFIKWYAWSTKYKDCDPSVWMTNYLNKRYQHNDEERIWLCWLYGNTYYLPTSWVLKNEFPDYELATVDRITRWNNENYKRLRYQTDTKYNKGHLPSMFESYKRFFKDNPQRDVIESLYGDNESQNFDNIWNAVNKHFHKFGRYTTWFYMQHLKHTAGIKINPTSLMLNDYSGSRSHRNGLCYALSKKDWIDTKLSNKEYEYLEAQSSDILIESKSRYPDLSSEFDNFTMETCLCSFKKIFRETSSRYLGYYLDRQSEEIQRVSSDNWNGIDWNVLWQARKETLDKRLDKRTGIDKNRFGEYIRSGSLSRLDWMFGDLNYKNDVGLEKFFA